MTEDRAPVSPDDRKILPSRASPKNRKAPSKNQAVKSHPPNATAPSAQSIDQIFSGRVIAEEAKDARLLFRQFSEYFGIQGASESELLIDLVLCRLRKHRLDRSMAVELRRAQMQSVIDEIEDRDQRYFHSPTRDEQKGNRRDEGPHAIFRMALLEHLKQEIKERGPDYEKDLLVSGFFGDSAAAHPPFRAYILL